MFENALRSIKMCFRLLKIWLFISCQVSCVWCSVCPVGEGHAKVGWLGEGYVGLGCVGLGCVGIGCAVLDWVICTGVGHKDLGHIDVGHKGPGYLYVGS